MPIIEDDHYWKKRYQFRWPNSHTPARFVKDLHHFVCATTAKKLKALINPHQNSESLETNSDVLPSTSKEKLNNQKSLEKSNDDTSFPQQCKLCPGFFHNKNWCRDIHKEKVQKVCNPLYKKWKTCFLEKYIEEELERMTPDNFHQDFV